MISKKPSDNMKQMYSEKRNATLNKIQEAINDIKEDNRIVTKTELMKLTGISSGTFSKDHVKELLKENKVCQYREVKTISKQEQRTKIEEETYLALKKENQKLLSKLQDYRNALDLNKKKHQKLLLDYDSLNTEHKLLKGKNQQLMEYLDALGTNLENIPLI